MGMQISLLIRSVVFPLLPLSGTFSVPCHGVWGLAKLKLCLGGIAACVNGHTHEAALKQPCLFTILGKREGKPDDISFWFLYFLVWVLNE